MQPTREDAFPSTCFSLNQNRAIGFRDLFRNVSQLRNGMAYTKKWICSLSACLRFFNQPALAISAVFQTSFHHHQQRAWICRLGEEIDRSSLYGLHRQVNRAMSRQNDDGNSGI